MFPFMPKDAQLKWADLVFAETRKDTSKELLHLSIEYGGKGRLAPIVSPMETFNDSNWADRGIFTTVDDPAFGPVITAQAQYKMMTETPPRTKWACRPVGYDNGFVYLKYLACGPEKLRKLEEAGVVLGGDAP
jgi:crotonobetainyl-CoA:carnitine CoA-transferase CaiB-like acyl-CoA transferase